VDCCRRNEKRETAGLRQKLRSSNGIGENQGNAAEVNGNKDKVREMFTQNVFVQLNKYRLQQEACAVKRTGHVQHIRSWPQSRPSAALRRPVPLNLAPDKSYRRPLKVRFHPCIKY
jgi:hypothetical protein